MKARRWGPTLATMIVAMALVVTACGGAAAPAPTSAPAKSAPAAAPAAAAPAQNAPAIQLKLSHHEVATGRLGQAIQKWADSVGEKTGGKLKITVFPSETLGKAADAYNDVTGGVADIAWVVPTFTPGQFPLSEMFNLPMIGIQSSQMGSKVTWEWYSTSPTLQKEWSKVKVLTAFCNGSFILATAKKPVRTLADANGLKIRAAGYGGTNYTKAIGAVPVNVPPPEIYESITKGILDGYMWDWQAVQSNRLYEVSSYFTDIHILNGYNTLVMNMDKWNSLPPDIQKTLDEMSGAAMAQQLSAAFDSAEPSAKDDLKKANREVITLSADEQARWRELAKPVWNGWIESVKGKLDGQAELDKLLAIIQKNSTN